MGSEEMKPKLLDLFCGAGGASMGYSRAGFEIVGVDINAQPNYPFRFIRLDSLAALRLLLMGTSIDDMGEKRWYLRDFSAIHASPPCQAYVDPNIGRKRVYPKLIESTRERLLKTGKHYVIENVQKAPLRATLMLCGTMFGLPLIRHRYFEWSVPDLVFPPSSCNHWGTVAAGDFACVVGYTPMGFRDSKGKRQKALPCKVTWEEAMGIDWMPYRSELKEAIPPAYTEYIGKYLLEVIIKEQVKQRQDYIKSKYEEE